MIRVPAYVWILVLLAGLSLKAIATSADSDFLAELKREQKHAACAELYGLLGVKAPLKEEILQPVTKNGRFALTEIPGHRPDAIYIGVSSANVGPEGYHFYLNVGKTRVGGYPFFRKSTVVSTGKIANEGMIFEIPVPPEMVSALEQRAAQGVSRGVSCIHVLCHFLEKEGIVLAERNGEKKITAKVVTANLVEGKLKIAGRDADPGTIRMLSTGPNELVDFLERGISSDQSMRAEAALRAAVIVGGTAAVPAVILVIQAKGQR